MTPTLPTAASLPNPGMDQSNDAQANSPYPDDQEQKRPMVIQSALAKLRAGARVERVPGSRYGFQVVDRGGTVTFDSNSIEATLRNLLTSP